jgi:hypothetical protein
MLETIKSLLSSQDFWSAMLYLVAGAIVGAFISIYLTFKAQRPKLIIRGGSSGSSSEFCNWDIAISNRPSFFGIPFNGETAHDVYASISLRQQREHTYRLYWNGRQRDQSTTIGPGEQKSLNVFNYHGGTRGYCIHDHAGDPVARFESRKLRFELRLRDRLGRTTKHSITVVFDDTHLKRSPQLEIISPMPLLIRWPMIKNAFRNLLFALGFRW